MKNYDVTKDNHCNNLNERSVSHRARRETNTTVVPVEYVTWCDKFVCYMELATAPPPTEAPTPPVFLRMANEHPTPSQGCNNYIFCVVREFVVSKI